MTMLDHYFVVKHQRTYSTIALHVPPRERPAFAGATRVVLDNGLLMASQESLSSAVIVISHLLSCLHLEWNCVEDARIDNERPRWYAQ